MFSILFVLKQYQNVTLARRDLTWSNYGNSQFICSCTCCCCKTHYIALGKVDVNICTEKILFMILAATKGCVQ